MTPLNLPGGSGEWLSRLFGPGPQQPGPPYVHLHAFPAEEEDDD